MTTDLLERARHGDGQAFRELTDPYRHELHVHCYRMLGSLTDAEDMLQETLLAAWRGLAGFAGRASLRAWLYRIATNRCLNALRDAGRRRPPEPTPSFDPPEPTHRGDVTWLQPYPDRLLEQIAESTPGPEAGYHARETIELAFIAGLQHLPPRQAAVLVLRDVLGYSTADVADMLGTTPTVVKGALQRARAHLDRERRDRNPECLALPESPRERELSRRFADAFIAGDVDGILTLLTGDAWLAMPPAPHEYHGRAAVASMVTTFLTWRGRRGVRLIPTRANTQPAFGCYLTAPGETSGYPAGLLVLTVGQHRIRGITWFLHDDVPPRFALPDTTR
ncbi:RNA polymerase subunit sigma-70 [Prauserella oleivorans]|uniref:RNA polymerase subunit sigma-70 n=1 Tax=Prauserella oleivorans TaxID=1478153 RepID=A0ABW5WF95_9PSEU